MKLSSWRYILPEPFISLKRNGWMSFAAVITMVISLFLCGIFWLLVMNIDNMAYDVESDIEIMAYLDDTVTEDRFTGIADLVKTFDHVESVTLVSKEEGLAEMAQKLGDVDTVYAALDGENPLPNAFRIRATEAQYVVDVAQHLSGMDQFEEINYGQGTVEDLLNFTGILRNAGFAIMALLGVAAVVLIMMTIRLTVYSRRKEIELMKYIGATNWFIRWPFILEGAILGLIGALIAFLCLVVSYDHIVAYAASKISFVSFLSLSTVLGPLAVGLLGAGILLGILGSVVGVIRFLKV